MTKQTYRLLFIEDTVSEATIIKQQLARSQDIAFEVIWVNTLSQGLKLLAAEKFDVVLSDLQLPDSYGLGTFQLVQDQAYHLPIVLLTNIEDDRMGKKAIQSGAQDYLIKSQIEAGRLIRTLLFAIERHKLLAELRMRYEDRIDSLRERLEVVG